jgi:hypothetical protein
MVEARNLLRMILLMFAASDLLYNAQLPLLLQTYLYRMHDILENSLWRRMPRLNVASDTEPPDHVLLRRQPLEESQT